ncbi:MAG: Xaa-Pro peptidase family protein [Thermomicrobiales bacterium]
MPDYNARLSRLREAMAANNVAVLFLPVSSTLEYFTGISWPIPNPTEHDRPGDWISGMYLGLRDGPIIVEPRMGSAAMVAAVAEKPWISDIHVLSELDDYSNVLAGFVRSLGGADGGRIALAEHAWAKTVIDVMKAVPGAEIINAHDLIWPMRMIKDEEEQALMRRAARLVDEAYEPILDRLELGMSANDIARVVDDTLFEFGADWTSFHTGIYLGGEAVPGAASVFEAHDRVLERGGSIAFDFGALLDGYCSDFGRPVFIGEPTDERRKVYELVMSAQAAAIERMVDGEITAAGLDDVARSIIADAGYGDQFIHRLGHSIGKDVHEPPFLLEADQTVLRTGMCFTIEPSVVLDDGGFIRVEDVVMVTPDGGVNFNSTGHELRVLDL